MSIVQWAGPGTVRSYGSQTTNISSIQSQIDAMDASFIHGSSTYWGESLCECYNKLESGPNNAASNKLCILMTDGQNNGADNPTSSSVCSLAQTASGGNLNSLSDLYSFLKNDKNYKILSILVGAQSGFSGIKAASSCSDDTSCVAHDNCPCDYYLFLANFADLENRANTIASYQKQISSSTETITSKSSVSVCSLDFLYALIAFGPFLAYLIYRVVVIKAKSKSIRKQLYEMIRSGDLSREDISRFATVAANLLLPKNYKSDVDWIISYIMFQCPCLLPASRSDLEAVFAASTIAL